MKNLDRIVDRIDEFISYKGYSRRYVTDKSGMASSTFAHVNSPEKDLSIKNALRILDTFPELNREWLLNGEGPMLSENKNEKIDYNLVNIYNLDVAAGMSTAVEKVDAEEYIIKRIPFAETNKGDIGFIVTGNSMLPKFSAGSIVVVREVQNWQEYFGFGNTFVLLLSDGRRILKKIMRSEESKDNVLAVSYNPEYPEEELPKKMIRRVWKVVAHFQSEGF